MTLRRQPRLTKQMRADIIRVARHVRSHDDRPYEQADRLLAQLAPDDVYARARQSSYEYVCYRSDMEG